MIYVFQQCRILREMIMTERLGNAGRRWFQFDFFFFIHEQTFYCRTKSALRVGGETVELKIATKAPNKFVATLDYTKNCHCWTETFFIAIWNENKHHLHNLHNISIIFGILRPRFHPSSNWTLRVFVFEFYDSRDKHATRSPGAPLKILRTMIMSDRGSRISKEVWMRTLKKMYIYIYIHIGSYI